MKYIFGIALMVFVGCNKLSKEVSEYYENGEQKTVQYFSSNNKKRIVKEIQYYPDGTLAYQKHFKNDKPNGEWQFWHSNGNVWSVGFYDNGQRVGTSRVYHENGQLFFEGEYINGKKDGEWVFFNEKGVVETKTTFDMGEVIENWNAESKNNK